VRIVAAQRELERLLQLEQTRIRNLLLGGLDDAEDKGPKK
jgi:hypothetical protein